MNIGIYIHVPFCRKKCDYCSFYSIPANQDSQQFEKYSDCLLTEIKSRHNELKDFIVDTIYFGGGTPSLINASFYEKIINTISKLFSISDKPEISLECNPDDFSVSKINDYKLSGINRVILGVQTLNKEFHNIIGRSPALVTEKQLFDFLNIPDITHCLDVIFGIPGQSKEALISEIRTVLKHKPEHVSAYMLSIEKNTPLYERIAAGDLDEMQLELFGVMIDIMNSSGYDHYEVSNYSLPGFTSRHNMKYWKYLPYAGFGPGAHSFYNEQRWFNRQSVNDYIINNGNIREQDIRNGNASIIEYLMTGLRLTKGISSNDFRKKMNTELPENIMAKFREMEKYELLFLNYYKSDIIAGFTRKGLMQMDKLIFDITESLL